MVSVGAWMTAQFVLADRLRSAAEKRAAPPRELDEKALQRSPRSCFGKHPAPAKKHPATPVFNFPKLCIANGEAYQ